MKRAGAGLVLAGLLGVLVACGAPPSGEPTAPFASIVIRTASSGVSSSSTVRLGSTQQFSATARDASGNPVAPQPVFTWSSSNPSVVSVNASGLATAVGDGVASITASASRVTSNAVTLTVRGTLEASGGTLNRGAGVPLGTFVAYKLRDSSGNPPTTSFQLSLSGPPDWNRGQPLVLNPANASGVEMLFLNSVAPVSGTYTLFANLGGQILSSSFSLNASQQMAQPLSVSVSNPSPTSVRASWGLVIGAASYVTRLVASADGAVAAEAVVVALNHTFAPSPPLSGTPYYVAAYGLSADLSTPDPALPAQVNASRRASASFTPAGSAAPGTISGTVRIADAEGRVDVPNYAALEPGSYRPGEVIVKFRPGVGLQSLGSLRADGVSLARVREVGLEGAALYRASADDQTMLEAIAALNRRADVEYAQPNFIYRPTQITTPNDPSFAAQWNYPAINLPQTWALERGQSSPVTVAVVDTGIFASHPDLSSKLEIGYDFVSDPTNAGDGNGRDGNPEDAGSAATSFFHGTHVAGTVAAATNNAAGVAGVSWGARILPVRALGLQGGTVSDITDGMLWAAGVTLPGLPPNPSPAQVINLSLGGERPCRQDPLYQDVINRVLARGVAVVVSAGNSTANTADFSPASCSGVVNVAASNSQTQRAYYSNYGPRVDLMAPGGSTLINLGGIIQGGGILSTLRTDAGQPNYAYYQGTSMAAPHVAGVLALMKSARPTLGVAEAMDILRRTARPFNSSQCSGEQGLSNGSRTPPPSLTGADCGAGLLDAYAAVQAAQAAASPGFSIRPDTSGAGAGAGSGGSVALSLERWGGFTGVVNLSVSGLPPGVTSSFTPNPAGASAATFQFNVAASTAPGIYNLTLSGTGAGQTRSVPFTLVVGVLPANLTLAGAKITAQFWNGSAAVAASSREVTLSANAAIAAYSVSSLPAGNYYLEGWLDLNRNGIRDDPDYLGVYQVGGSPTLVTQPATGINFELYPVLNLSGLGQNLLNQSLSWRLSRLTPPAPTPLSDEPQK